MATLTALMAIPLGQSQIARKHNRRMPYTRTEMPHTKRREACFSSICWFPIDRLLAQPAAIDTDSAAFGSEIWSQVRKDKVLSSGHDRTRICDLLHVNGDKWSRNCIFLGVYCRLRFHDFHGMHVIGLVSCIKSCMLILCSWQGHLV